MVDNPVVLGSGTVHRLSAADFPAGLHGAVCIHWRVGGIGFGTGGIRAFMEDSFDTTIFITGFFTNSLLASALAYFGDKLGLELYLAAVVVFGVRLFQNMGIIRRYLLKKY